MDYLALVVCKIAVSVVSALGLYLCATLCGQLSLGSAGFMSLGAYIFALFGSGFGVAAAPIILFAVTFPMGLVLLRLSGDYLAAATLGIAELVRIALSNLTLLGGAGGYRVTSRITVPTALISAVAVWFFTELFSRSKIGHLCKATAIDSTAARACGVDTQKLKSLTFALSCAVCGFAGCLYAGAVGFISPLDFTFTRSCETLAAVMLGGKNPTSVMLCAAALETISAVLVGFAELKLLIYGATLLVVCLKRRKRVA